MKVVGQDEQEHHYWHCCVLFWGVHQSIRYVFHGPEHNTTHINAVFVSVMAIWKQRLLLPWPWSFQKIVMNSQLPMAKTSGRKFSSCNSKPDITGLNLPVVCTSLKRNRDGSWTAFCFFDSESNACLFHFPDTQLRRECVLFLPASSYVLQFSLLEGNEHKRCNKTHFVAFGFVETYPVVFFWLFYKMAPVVWRHRSKDQPFIAVW